VPRGKEPRRDADAQTITRATFRVAATALLITVLGVAIGVAAGDWIIGLGFVVAGICLAKGAQGMAHAGQTR
jgi:hypothetical protein